MRLQSPVHRLNGTASGHNRPTMARYHRLDIFTQQTATAHNGQLTGHNHPPATANPDQLATIKPATIGRARQTLRLTLQETKKKALRPF